MVPTHGSQMIYANLLLMISELLVAGLLSCDPALTALFTPPRPRVGRYEVCVTPASIDEIVAEAGSGGHYGPVELVEALDAFGTGGDYDRAELARLYGGRRARVVRGWIERNGRIESVTLISPRPDRTLTRLEPDTMVIRYTVGTRGL